MLDASQVKFSGRQVHTTTTAGQAAAQAINSRDVLCAWDAIIAGAPIDSTITLHRIVLQGTDVNDIELNLTAQHYTDYLHSIELKLTEINLKLTELNCYDLHFSELKH